MIADDHAFAERIRNLIPINGLDPRLQAQALAQGELLEFRKKKTVFEVGARDPYTFYLLDGELELQAKESSPLRMSAGDENARRALAQLQPRRYTAVAVTPVSVFRIERAVLDCILADEQMLEESAAHDMDVRELEDDEEEDDADWMSRLLSSELFTRLPHENIQRFFSELEPLEAKKDAVVVEQGTSGDFLYIVAEGRCAVVRRAPGGGQEAQLAILKEGDTFGEESLISNSPRNASVRMISDGMLMRLPKAAFEELVSNPTLKAVPWSEASKLAENGALWVDVRFADEHQSDGIEGSINAPLNALRLQAGGLDRERKYIVYCDSGARSSAGAFLMARLGFDTCYLAGGLERSPLGGPSSTTSAPPVASDDENLADAAAGAFEFEFTSAGDAVEDEVIAAADDRGLDDDDGKASADAPLDSTAETAPTPPVQAPAAAAAKAPAPPRSAQQPTPADGQHPQMAKARAALVALKAERDKAAAYGKKAADAAREYKQRNEELGKAVQSERERREQLDKELAATKADAERRASMEQTRLSSELEKAGKRIDALQAERDQAQQRAAEDLAKLQALVDDNDARLDAVVKDKEEAAAMHVSAEAAFQDLLQNVQSDAKAAEARAQSIETELERARERLVELEAHDSNSAQQQLAETSEIKIGLAQTQAHIEEERKQLDLDRAQLNDELRKMHDEQQQAQDRLLAERTALKDEIAKAHTRNEALDQREIELTDARDAVDQTLQQREQSLVDREAALAQRDQALSDEKSLWQQTVDKAIADERARLESEHARIRQETEALTEQRIQAMLEEKTQELNAEHEEQQTQMRGQVEAHVAKLLAEFDARLVTVRNGYETQLSEQEAMLEDERRRLETEIVRLREALADARQAAAPVVHTPVLERDIELPAAQAEDAPALDFELNESAAATIKSEEPTAADASVAPAADVDLELQIDEPDDESEERTEVPEVPTLEIDVPRIEMPQLEETEAAFDGKPSEKRDRVISTNQLAEIRARMQEKMRAAKSKTG